MARLLLEGHPLVQVPSDYRVSPSWASRELKAYLPKVDPDLARREGGRLRELYLQHQRLAARIRWSQQRASLGEQLRHEVGKLQRAGAESNPTAIAEAAVRAHTLTDRIADIEVQHGTGT